MQPIEHETGAVVVNRGSHSDFALRISGPGEGQLEVSVDGGPYRRCRYADGFWWHHWAGTLAAGQPLIVVVRRSDFEAPGPAA